MKTTIDNLTIGDTFYLLNKKGERKDKASTYIVVYLVECHMKYEKVENRNIRYQTHTDFNPCTVLKLN